MRLQLGFATLLAMALPDPARGEARPHRVVLSAAAGESAGPAGIALAVPYTLGTHNERVVGAEGELRLDPATLALAGGRLVVPLSAIRSDDATLECHLREALGLDYARSRYPGDHVCENDRLPATGPDAVAFPEIVLDLSRGGPLGDPAVLDRGGEVPVEAEGTFAIHGVTRPVRLRLTASRDPSSPGALRIRGSHVFRLADFGVVVKPVKILFVKISVGDEVTAVVDARLVPLEPAPR
jgi:polyisoprenoid-binding protein YceI